MKRARTHLPATTYALQTLGAQIAVARRDLGWTAAMLAERLGVTPALVARLEQGAPGTAVGTVLEAAVLCGVPLFDIDPRDTQALAAVADRERLRLALLPSRMRRKPLQVSSEF